MLKKKLSVIQRACTLGINRSITDAETTARSDTEASLRSMLGKSKSTERGPMDQNDTATRKFTDMDAATLRASMGRFEGVCVVATVNPDGTPDAAIFAPAMPDDEHVILMLANNHTRANIERTGVAHLVYDVPNPTAEDKAARHAGARLDLALVRPDGDTAKEHRRVAESFPRMNPAVMILRIERILPVG